MFLSNSTSGFNSTIGFNVTTPVDATGISSAHSSHHGLPLQPRLTPAFGVAGALLMITSIPYAFVSLRLGWVYMSLSCAYLISICITVLILDVMSVPDEGISNSIQGAYLIAIALPGILLGGFLQWYLGWLARRFGCVLGGFCMAMWLETLRPGGLIRPRSMTAVLIGVMCLVSLAPSIPMIKKWADLAYMVFSAFSGSTALVLGIDCYSRAGLKEFWVYTWHSNRVKLFGFETRTYPMTKSIIAEIVIIPVVFLFALVIQGKAWKPLRDRKNREAARIAELREDQERQALEIGRAVQIAEERDMAAWKVINKDPEKQPDVNQKPVNPPSRWKVVCVKAGEQIYRAKEFLVDKLKPDVRVSVMNDAREQRQDKNSPVRAPESNAEAVLDTTQSQRLVSRVESSPVDENTGGGEAEEQTDEVEELRGLTSVIPILERLKNVGILNEHGGEVAFTLRPTSKRPPLILPQIDYECDTPLDEVDEINMRPIIPSPPALVEKARPLNLHSGVEDTKGQSVVNHEGGGTESSRNLDELHKDEEVVPTKIRLSHEEISEWNRHITQKPDVEEENANEEHPALDNQEDTHTSFQYAHLRSTSDVPDSSKRLQSLTQFPKFAALKQQGSEEAISRTHEWSKTLGDAEPNSRVSSIRSYEVKDESSLWAGFEGTHPTKGSAERLEEHDVAASQSQRDVLSRSSALKVNKRRSRPISNIEGKTAIQPTPVKSARVSKRNASLPALDTGSTLLDAAATRKELKKKQRSLSTTFVKEESQGDVARRNFGSHGKFEERSPCNVELTDPDEITLSERRRTLHTRRESNSQVSSISSQGHFESSSLGCRSPVNTTARTTPTVSSPFNNPIPPFKIVAPQLRGCYPIPPVEGIQSSVSLSTAPPYWYSNGACSPSHPYAHNGIQNPGLFSFDHNGMQESTSTNRHYDPRMPQRMSVALTGPIPTLMHRVEFDERLKKQKADEQLDAQRRGILTVEAAKIRQREKEQRRRALEIEEKMRRGGLDDVHKERISKMQREAVRNLERQDNKHYR